ncbi:MAG: hypothetical protein H0U92_04975 [Actinobacteria bacterium]|nr:hypothetical protein [Actinomycetota bacterium]
MALFAAPVLMSAPAVGAAEFVTPANDPAQPGAPLSSGQRATPFSLKLPSGAACTRDSANGGYRVQSFMVPEGVDPLTLSFDSTGPTPNSTGASFRQPLFAVASAPYVDAQTSATAKKDDPGVIVNVPAFNLTAFAAGDVPVGKYTVGIACTKGPASATQLDRVWATSFTVDANLAWTTGPGPAPARGALPSSKDASAASPVAAVPESAPLPAAAPTRASLADPAAQDAPGGDPSFSVPVIDAISIPAFSSRIGVFVYLALAAALARVAYLLRRSRERLP